MRQLCSLLDVQAEGVPQLAYHKLIKDIFICLYGGSAVNCN